MEQTSKKGISANGLKTIAILAMAVDHTSVAFFQIHLPLGCGCALLAELQGPLCFI